MANIPLKTIKFPGLDDTYTVPQVDNTLSVTGAAADAKKTGDEISELNERLHDLDRDTLGLYPQIDVASTAIALFDDGADDIPVKALEVAINLVQRGTGDPSPSNIRRISGWSGANICVTGKNVIPSITEGGTSGGVTWTVENGIVTLSGTATETVSISGEFSSFVWDGVTPLWLSGCPSGGDYANKYSLRLGTQYVVDYSKPDVGIGRALEAGNGDITYKPLRFDIIIRSGQNCDGLVFKPMLNVGESADAYEVYKGKSYVVDWTTEAGMAYGGTLDVTTGLLTVTSKSVILDQNNEWTMYAEGKFCCNVITADEAKRSTIDYISNQYVFAGNGANISTDITTDKRFYGQRNLGRFWVYDSSYTTLEAFKTALASHSLQIVYPITTPVTYQLTPTEVDTLLGQNNIFCDTGNITLTYRASLDRYFDNKVSASQALMELIITANRETTMTASQAYSEGDLIIISGTLYKAASSIASGATFTPGTNVITTTVAEQLSAIA